MKIALLGYGKMGKLIEQIAINRGDEIIVKTGRLPLASEALQEADVAIDFSDKDAVLPHVKHCMDYQVPLIIGTTGWEADLALVQQLVKETEGKALFSPNFSLGVYLFFEIMRHASVLLQPFDQYDVSATEWHHAEKKDKPSGTAKLLTSLIHYSMPRLPKTFSFQSVRSEEMPGTHTVLFESSADFIQLTHEAKNRSGFAIGALEAAEWILSKKSGFYMFDDYVQDQLKGCNHAV